MPLTFSRWSSEAWAACVRKEARVRVGVGVRVGVRVRVGANP